ncbi:MAG: hypothetical protein KAW95_03320 [Dehalococcoidia bacterium]|nr:hypothetical protein [Dehalococcoidia bacterium]
MGKRLVVLLVAVVAIVGLLIAGCAPEAAPPEEEEAPPEEEEEEEAPAPPAEEVITWKVQNSYDAANPANVICSKFCDSVTSGSGGRLVFKNFTGGSIAPACKEVDAVNKGVIEMCYTCPMYNLDKWPAAGLFSARPGQLPSEAFCIWYNQGEGTDLINKMVAGYDLVVLKGAAPRPAEIWAHSTVPIESVGDIKGLRMRTSGDGGEVLQRMGASVVFMPGGELYEAMQRGVIDAFEYSNSSVNWDMGFQEIAKYLIFSATRAPSDPLVFFANSDAWNDLPSDLKVLVEDMSLRWTQEHNESEFVKCIVAVENFRDFGCELSHLPADVESAFLKEAAEFYAEKAAGEEAIFGEILDSMSAFQKAYAGYMALDAPLVSG